MRNTFWPENLACTAEQAHQGPLKFLCGADLKWKMLKVEFTQNKAC